MSATEERHALLEQLGRYYGQEHFAVAFTGTNNGENAKRVVEQGWDRTRPLADAGFGASLLAGRGATRNIAIVLRPSNLIVVECDSEEDLVRVTELQLPQTLTVQSSAAYKRHFYFRPAPELEHLPYVAFRFENGKLTADSGRYFLAPPSIHPSGAIYSFLAGLGPGETDIAELPEHIYRDLAKQAGLSQRTAQLEPGAPIAAGARDQTLASIAGGMRRRGATQREILAALRVVNEDRCLPPLDDRDVERISASIARYTPAQTNGAAPAVDYDDEPGPTEPPEPHSWTPVDLVGRALEPPEPPVIGGIVYPGRRHLFSGEPESLKSWAAMILCADQIRAGETVAYIDFEMGARETLARLRDLNLTDQELTDQFIYIEPDQPYEDPEIQNDTAQLLAARQPTLIVIDAFTGALSVHKLNPNIGVEIEQFYRTVIDPLRAHGAAVVVLDHLPKDPLNRGKFAIGSERKVGAAEVHLGFETITPFGRGRAGLAKITTHKDRPGHLPRPKTAELELISNQQTNRITWKLTLGENTAPDEPFRPTHLMEKVSAWLEQQRDSTALSGIEEQITGRRGYVRKALDQLVREGYVTEETGPRKARLFTARKQYREESDPLLHTPENDLAPPRPHLAPGEVKSAPATSPPPYRGQEQKRGEVKGQKQADLAPHENDDEPGPTNTDDDIPF